MNIKCNVTQCKFNKNNKCINDEIEINFSCDDYEYAYCSKYDESDEYIESHYKMQKLNISPYDYIIFGKSFYSSTDYIKHITDSVKERDRDTMVFLFDNLLNQGNNEERYIKIIWNYKEDEIKEMNWVNISKKDEIRKISLEYYKDQKELIENSILNSVQKKMILKGIVI